MLVEFAIALPLLVLILYALAMVSLNIFKLSRDQLADYVLESEAQYAMERITQAARFAREVEVHNNVNEVKFIYHSVEGTDYNERVPKDGGTKYRLFINRDVWETRYFFAYKKAGRNYPNLYTERQKTSYTSPITGDNYFGDTKLNYLRCSKLKDNEKVLRIELEMESLVTEHKIKIATAVFIPGLEAMEIY